MNNASVFGLVMFTLFVIAAIIVGNLFFSKILGVKVSELPAFFKFLTHLVGAFFVFIFVKKFFAR